MPLTFAICQVEVAARLYESLVFRVQSRASSTCLMSLKIAYDLTLQKRMAFLWRSCDKLSQDFFFLHLAHSLKGINPPFECTVPFKGMPCKTYAVFTRIHFLMKSLKPEDSEVTDKEYRK